MIGTAGNEARATGEWLETGKGKNGKLITIKGYLSDIYVREGDDWKIRVRLERNPGQCATHEQEFSTTTGRQRRPRLLALASNSRSLLSTSSFLGSFRRDEESTRPGLFGRDDEGFNNQISKRRVTRLQPPCVSCVCLSVIEIDGL